MRCPRCQQDNPAHARFCLGCGARLALGCGACGAELPEGARFCLQCGQAVAAGTGTPVRSSAPKTYTPKHLAEKILTSKSALEGERKQVTVLFADLKGSMELLADRDPEEARKLLDPVLERMMEAVHRYEGTVNQVMGDGIMALFGAPLAHEDHAVRACYAALRMQDSVKQYAEAVRRAEGVLVQIRVGLNSGEVVVRSIGSDLHMDYTAVGPTTHLAGRMEQMAAPGSILLTAEVLRLAEGYVGVTPLGPMSVKGLSAPIEVYEVTGARVKLTGAELRRFATTYAVYAGVNHENDCAFMLAVYPGGARELFWTCAFRSGASGPGTAHVTWDEVCTQYKWLYAGEPNCWQYYRIGPDKYESWREGKHVATFTKLK
jgi:class 3 adenylate cyclase